MDENLLRFDKNKTRVFIDFETFNLCLSFHYNRPWQAGLIKFNPDGTQEERDILVKWDCGLSISEDAARITRYDHGKVLKYGAPPSSAFQKIHDWLEAADLIIGHNILGFDFYLLNEWYRLEGKGNARHLLSKFIDTNCVAKAIKMNLHKSKEESLLEFQYKLLDTVKKGVKTNQLALCKEYDIEVDESRLHEAVYDLTINKQIWDKIKYQIEA